MSPYIDVTTTSYYQCGHPGHISRDCPNWSDICLITTDEQDEFMEQMMAKCDALTIAAREAT
jgi:hypothetical protein